MSLILAAVTFIAGFQVGFSRHRRFEFKTLEISGTSKPRGYLLDTSSGELWRLDSRGEARHRVE